MTIKEMEELAEIVVDIETYDDQIEPMHRLYTAVKHMIESKKPEFLNHKANQHSEYDEI